MAEEYNAILYISTSDYKTQLYVTRNYEDIWGRKSTEIYKDLAIWQKYLITEHQSEIYNKILRRKSEINTPNATIYCIKTPAEKLQWVLDRNFIIREITAGVAYPLTSEQLEGKAYQDCVDKVDKVILKFYIYITKDQPTIQAKDSPLYPFFDTLSKREKEILKYILYGLSAEQIANKLFVSRRTIETHTDAIKVKFQCNNKSEIIIKAIENDWIRVSLPEDK